MPIQLHTYTLHIVIQYSFFLKDTITMETRNCTIHNPLQYDIGISEDTDKVHFLKLI